MRWFFATLTLAACTPQPDPAALRALFDADQVARLDVSVLFVTGADVATALVPVAQHGPVQTWQSRDDLQIAENAGVVLTTHGLGHDLIAADAAGMQAAFSGQATVYSRHWVHLDGKLQPVTRSAQCRMITGQTIAHQAPLEVVPVTVFVETCGADEPIINHYHIAGDGVMWWSHQWISAQIGMVELERVAR